MPRSGFIALVGRPNVGKSTLVNAMVGQKVAIVSDKPQTTRRAIRGVVTHGEEWQIVIVDLPGVQRPRDSLTERMQHRVERELADADGVLFIVNAVDGVGGPGDRFIARAVAGAKGPVVIGVNKIDQLKPHQIALALTAAAELNSAAEIFPISARSGTGIANLEKHLAGFLPESPFYFPLEDKSDLSEKVQVAELVREQVLRRTKEEVPHSVEVQIEEIENLAKHMNISGNILVETESQKGILIGAKGKMIKAIGVASRKEIETLLGRHVNLDLSVKVRRKWRTDDEILDRLGIN